MHYIRLCNSYIQYTITTCILHVNYIGRVCMCIWHMYAKQNGIQIPTYAAKCAKCVKGVKRAKCDGWQLYVWDVDQISPVVDEVEGRRLCRWQLHCTVDAPAIRKLKSKQIPTHSQGSQILNAGYFVNQTNSQNMVYPLMSWCQWVHHSRHWVAIESVYVAAGSCGSPAPDWSTSPAANSPSPQWRVLIAPLSMVILPLHGIKFQTMRASGRPMSKETHVDMWKHDGTCRWWLVLIIWN